MVTQEAVAVLVRPDRVYGLVRERCRHREGLMMREPQSVSPGN
jgi:hypothetical protein